MEQLSSVFARLWEEIAVLFSTWSLQVILLVGSGLLAIALLVLALTRWGQAKPIWKCVVLSVMAHILFMGYAYGTHLIFKVPAKAEISPPIKINLVTDDGQDPIEKPGNVEAAAEEKPWDKFVTEAMLPDVESLARPEFDSRIEMSRSIEPTQESPAFDLETEPTLPTMPETELASIPDSNESDPFSLPSDDNSNEMPELLEAQPAEIVPTIPAPAENIVKAELEKAELEQAELEKADDVQVAENQDDADDEFESSEKASEVPSESTAENLADNESVPQKLEAVVQETNPPSVPASPDKSPVEVVQSGNMKPVSKPDPNAFRQVSAPRRLADGKPIPSLYSARTEPNRLATVKKRGGSESTEKAVENGLRFLSAQQEPDGSWNPRKSGGGQERMVFGHNRQGAGINADTAITAISVLAFLANGHTHLDGPYQETVQHGLEFLVRGQAQNGDLAGSATFFARTYCHSMSLLAISEALALTGDQRLMPAVQAGVDFSVANQNRNDGGWRYRSGDPGDMSQFGWKVLALHSAKLGGARVPESTTMGMKRFLHSCSTGRHKGLASYRPQEQVSTTMTAEALVCRNFLDGSVPAQPLKEATSRIMESLPSKDEVNLYYWYYGTMAMYNAGPQEWDAWNRQLTEVLVSSQVQTGQLAGSWEPNGLWAGYGGRVYSTAMATLCLEIYYRYLPMYEVARESRKRNIR